MGVHTGEAATTVVGLVGVDVHRAARVAALAYGGQVLLSETERTAEPWQEPEAGYRLDSLGKVRISLGEEQFERAYASGMALSLDQALDLALGTARNA